MLNNFSIRFKIGVFAVSMILIVTIISGLSVYNMSDSAKKMESMYNDQLKSVQYLEENRAYARTVLSELFRLILLTGDKNAQDIAVEKINSIAKEFNENYDRFKKIGNHDEKEARLIGEIDKNLAEYREARKVVIDLALQGKQEEAIKAYDSVDKPAEAFLKAMVELADYNIAIADKVDKENDAENKKAYALFIGIVIFSLLVSIMDTWLIARAIANPIKVAIKHINDIAEYNLQNNISEKYTLRRDEVGELARIIEKIEANLRSLIKAIGNTSEHVAASSEELTATSQQAAIAANEVAKAIDEIAKGATDQAQSTSDGAHQLTQLGDLIEEEKDNVKVLSESSDRVNLLVKEGLEVIESLAEKTHDTLKASLSVYQSIIKTDESSNHISEASGLISSIAQQTNLLALNASIEAARAGEYGKGFSVVADEIRKLAEQSAQSIMIIDEMVHSLQKDSKEAVEIMEKVQMILDEQNKNVDHTERKYKEISDAILTSSNAVDAIEKTAILMENKKNEVLDTMQSLSAVAQENAAGAEEASASIEEQTSSMDDIAKSSEDLSVLAQELNTLITKFKL